MFNVHKEEIQFGGRPLTLETGRVARQADGAVWITYGETVILATAVAQKKANPDVDFFPLTVIYQEKTYAAGKIPGGFFKREGRPSEKEVLTSRLIDRPLRPNFPAGFRNETQVILTVLSHDMENDPDMVALIGASAALAISGIPLLNPIAGARVGYIDGEYVLNPTLAQMEETDLDLVVAGTSEGVMMVESEAQELPEDIMLGAVMYGWEQFQPVIEAIERLVKKAGKETWEVAAPSYDIDALKKEVAKLAEADLRKAFAEKDKQTRSNMISEAHSKAIEMLCNEELGDKAYGKAAVSGALKKLDASIVRGQILDGKPRIDGRDTVTVRQIETETHVLPRAHGSALFTRGETQALAVATLGTSDDEQMIDALAGEYRSNFMLHYNFPPYSVGEARRMGSPGRREIGHGKLAWRSIKPLLPKKEDFPYTMRVVSEVTESNGSSSMATVCGTSMALMDAGVPLKRPVAGIAMGLIKEEDGKFAVLTDIMGDEDHLGDMDFKVAGTEEGITALQMDIKITSVTKEIMEQALQQAHDGRLHILGKMAETLDTARQQMADNAPQIKSIKINPDRIRDVIGSGGKVIRQIVEDTGARVNIDDDGKVEVSANDAEKIQAAVDWILSIAADPEPGTIYQGKVAKIMDFGAFVTFMPGKDGLVHISQLVEERVEKVTDIVSEGDMVWVKLLKVDDRGKFRLSMIGIDQETGEDANADSNDDEEAA